MAMDTVMRRDWDQWAGKPRRVDPRADDEASLWRLGIADAEMILADVSDRIPASESALELGCGWGRLLRPMAAHFRNVSGVDISEAMLAKARTSLADLPNVHLHQNDGQDLSSFDDEAFDFCYSMFLFDCLPTEDVVRAYLSETYRVLKRGGIFKAQVAGVYPGNPFRPVYADACTWHGVRFTLAEISALFERAGFEVCSAYHAHTEAQLVSTHGKDPSEDQQYRLWIIARKGSHMDSAEAQYADLARRLMTHLPSGAHVLSPEPGMTPYLVAVVGDALRLEPLYKPASGADAVASLERHRAHGARLIFFTAVTAWWLEHYPELSDWLRMHGQLVDDQPGFRIFDILPAPATKHHAD